MSVTRQALARYRELRFWSPVLGCDASRLYIFDENGQEHYAIIPMTSGGRLNRERRRAALDAIVAHIEAGEPAGEIAVKFDEAMR